MRLDAEQIFTVVVHVVEFGARGYILAATSARGFLFGHAALSAVTVFVPVVDSKALLSLALIKVNRSVPWTLMGLKRPGRTPKAPLSEGLLPGVLRSCIEVRQGQWHH